MPVKLKQLKQKQSDTFTPEVVRKCLRQHCPASARSATSENRELVQFKQPTKTGVDKANLKIWAPCFNTCLDENKSAVFNKTVIEDGFRLFDTDLGVAIQKPSHNCNKRELWPGQHINSQAYRIKQHFMSMLKASNYVTSGAWMEPWLNELLVKMKQYSNPNDMLVGPTPTVPLSAMDTLLREAEAEEAAHWQT